VGSGSKCLNQPQIPRRKKAVERISRGGVKHYVGGLAGALFGDICGHKKGVTDKKPQEKLIDTVSYSTTTQRY